MMAMPIPLLALVMTARVSADAPTPTYIEVFTDSRHRIATEPHRGIVIYPLDEINRFEQQLSTGLPADVDAAKPEAIQRLQHTERTAVTKLKHTYQGLLKARRYGLDRYPAIVFDASTIVYGVTHLKTALAHYRRWRHQHEARYP